MDERIQARTQELVALQVGQLVLRNAALMAENEQLRAAAAVQAGGSGIGAARSAEQPTGQDTI